MHAEGRGDSWRTILWTISESHLPWKGRPSCYTDCCFGQYQVSSGVLGWLGDGKWYMYILCKKGRHLECTCHKPSWEEHIHVYRISKITTKNFFDVVRQNKGSGKPAVTRNQNHGSWLELPMLYHRAYDHRTTTSPHNPLHVFFTSTFWLDLVNNSSWWYLCIIWAVRKQTTAIPGLLPNLLKLALQLFINYRIVARFTEVVKVIHV